MQNFDESYFAEGIAARELALPAGDVREPFVDAEDIADVAVAALTEDGHAGRLYELTGPRLLSFEEAVGEIGRATGRPVRYAPIPIDAFAAGLQEQGVPSDVVALLRYLFTEVLDGRNSRSRTACGRRSAASRATSRATPGAPPPRAPGAGSDRYPPAGTSAMPGSGARR